MLFYLTLAVLGSLAHGDRIADLERSILGLQDELFILKNGVALTHRRIDTLKASTTPFVAFTMTVSADRDYEDNDVVKFDREITNTGEYDNGSDKFVCPLSGYYMFSITIYKGSSSEYNFGVRLSVDGEQITSIDQSYDGQANLYMHSSSTVIAHCNAGNEVFIQADKSGSLIAVGNRSSFSGLLLRLDEE